MLLQTEQSLSIRHYGREESPALAGQKTLNFLRGMGATAEVVDSKFMGYDDRNAYYQVTLEVPEDWAESVKALLGEETE